MESAKTLSVHLESQGERWPHVDVRRLTSREAISELFHVSLELVISADHALGSAGAEAFVAEHAYPGADVTVVFEREGLEVRRVHGVVSRLTDRLEVLGEHRSYELTVAPHAHLLTLVETQEVYLDLAVPEILRQKLELHGLGADDFELRLLGDYPKREIVVQYGESDLAFVCRLAEHVGISFFFEHGDEKDKWVFTDHPDGFGRDEDLAQVPFHARGEALGVFSLRLTTDLIPGTFIVQDYNHRVPLLEPTGEHGLEGDLPGGVIEYGPHVKTPDEAAALARVRAEERLAQKRVFEGASSVVGLGAGRRVELTDHPRLEDDRHLLLTEVTHEVTFPLFGEAAADATSYRNGFRAIPASVVHRPRRRTPRPRMPGVVTGIIQPGPDGEVGGVAKLTDDGRYTVILHFDTASAGRTRASHPIRMAQPFAGHGNGMHFPLLPGTEVLVAFANGDPDRPVIVGSLPNPVSPAPVVNDEAHTHRIRTSKGVTIEFGNTVLGRR